MDREAKIFVAGHRGLVGSAITRRLQQLGYHNLLLRTSAELDLKNSGPVNDFLQQERPDYVFLAAAKVGGIHANNSFPADFIYDNLSVQNSVIHGCHIAGVKRLMFLGSSCVYPRECPQPIKEEYLLTGPLEKTNDAYAIAKIAGIKMCESYNRQYGTRFIAVMPTNLYGPFDNYDLENSHVLPAMLRKFHEAREQGETVRLWGSGKPRREFLHSDDMAAACVFLMNLPDDRLFADGFPLINIGCGEDVSIKELAEMIAKTVDFTGSIEWDSSKPDGTPRKLLDVGRLNRLGWYRQIELAQGLKLAYQSFLNGETRQHR
ncbi:MAG: GDP-L-fucose synthase [Candidatus Riflebacteria bacterium]